MKKVIISGANGFVGSNLVRYLSKKDIFVYALVRKMNDKFSDINNVKVIECSMNEYKNLHNIIVDKDIDVFYHFAWEGTVGIDRSRYDIQLNNIRNTCDALISSEKLNIKKFIFAGSIIEYEYFKCREKGIKKISENNIYGIAKAMAKNILEVQASNLSIEFISTIISNIYGPGESSDRLIKSIIKKALKNERVSLTSCEQLYDFIYITDAIRAFYLIGENGTSFQEYYIGNKNIKKMKEYIYEISQVFNGNIELGIGDIDFTGVSLDYTEFDKSVLYDKLRFNTEVSFVEGIKETVKWIREEGI